MLVGFQDWTTNEVIIVEKKDVEKIALDKFSYLEKQMGLSRPIINRETWKTRISYLGKETGFEIELDWRELDAFVLLVRLEEGKLPKGYYVSQGRKCRLIIEQILKDEFHISLDEMNKINQSSKKSKQRSIDTMIKRLEEYQNLLLNYSQALLSYGPQLFETRIRQ